MLVNIKGLGEDVCKHIFSGLVLDCNLLLINELPDVVVLHLDVPGLLAGNRPVPQ